jgi:hypothetical protein
MKYSEKTFDKKNIILLFDSHNKKNQLSPSYLLLAPDEYYAKKAALEIAGIILSSGTIKQRQQDEEKIISHPDLIFLEPEGENKSIGVDEIREASSRINLKPYRADKKILIINQAYKMTEQAQNAFLKTLEEPPKNTIIFLICKEVIGLLETVKSRCKIIRLSTVDTAENSYFLKDEDQLIENFLDIKDNRYFDYFNFTNKEDYRRALITLYMMFRDIILMKEGITDAKVLFIAKDKKVCSFAEIIDENKCCKLIEVFDKTYRYIMSNVNLRLSQINISRTVSKIMES